MGGHTKDGAFPFISDGVERLTQGSFKMCCQVLPSTGSHGIFLSLDGAATLRVFEAELKGTAATHVERELFEIAIRKIRCVDDANDPCPAQTCSKCVSELE